ncbi:uncharacterized protein VP01_480g1 [Puccinia sorghi]|uniref:Uncharacterized protein n=1 Tax=Puccinia sorghi TaxID=27349 RepID=A0A0L6UPI2_9BASI|nr:uncharacterized protein VP01_480g1 [Puccinia sorghi]
MLVRRLPVARFSGLEETLAQILSQLSSTRLSSPSTTSFNKTNSNAPCPSRTRRSPGLDSSSAQLNKAKQSLNNLIQQCQSQCTLPIHSLGKIIHELLLKASSPKPTHTSCYSPGPTSDQQPSPQPIGPILTTTQQQGRCPLAQENCADPAAKAAREDCCRPTVPAALDCHPHSALAAVTRQLAGAHGHAGRRSKPITIFYSLFQLLQGFTGFYPWPHQNKRYTPPGSLTETQSSVPPNALDLNPVQTFKAPAIPSLPQIFLHVFFLTFFTRTLIEQAEKNQSKPLDTILEQQPSPSPNQSVHHNPSAPQTETGQ